MPKVSVIIPAAGASSRFAGKVKKPFAVLESRPLFMRSVEVFVNRKDVIQIQLVVAPDDVDDVKRKFGPHLGLTGVKVVTGGAKRTDSVLAALKQVKDEADLVAVHDAVRPCVSSEDVDRVIRAAAEHGAAILAAPLADTLKQSDDGKHISATLDRKGLWLAQTPQVFSRRLLERAYANAANVPDATDDARLVEALGEKVALVPGNLMNMKVTLPGDLKLARAILKALPKPKPKGPLGPYEEDKMW